MLVGTGCADPGRAARPGAPVGSHGRSRATLDAPSPLPTAAVAPRPEEGIAAEGRVEAGCGGGQAASCSERSVASPPGPSAAAAPADRDPRDPTGKAALFRRFPELGRRLPHVALGRFPSRVDRLELLGAKLGVGALFVKRDDLAGAPYGGNKVRKLEFLLGDAKARGHGSVVTFGGVGSNHALATALYARRAGLRAVLLLLPQPPSAHVRHNLLAELAAGAELRLGSQERIDALRRAASAGQVPPTEPYVIELGGSSPLGNVGMVNAAFELADQVALGELPAPDRIFIAAGTLGSAVGLGVGLRAAGLGARVVAVRASSTDYVNDRRLRAMADATVALLRSLDPSFPPVELGPLDVVIEHRQVGAGYAMPTAKSRRAAELVASSSPIVLDATYTAKAFAALVDAAPTMGDEVVLFWQTFDPTPMDRSGARSDELPRALRGYATDR